MEEVGGGGGGDSSRWDLVEVSVGVGRELE